MSLTCPRCGGAAVQELKDGLIRCNSQVHVGDQHVPPQVTGAGFHVLPVFGECGHVFQIGRLDSTCNLCGRSALGYCEDCSGPTCHVHGTSSGAFICSRCVNEHARAEQQRREQQLAEARQAKEHAADEIRSGEFSTANAPDLFAAGVEAMTVEEVMRAWTAFTERPDVPSADDEALLVQFISTWLSGVRATGHDRAPIWLATVNDKDFWVCSDGRVWREAPDNWTSSQTATFAVFKGARPTAQKNTYSYSLINGELLQPVDQDDVIVRSVIASAVRIATSG